MKWRNGWLTIALAIGLGGVWVGCWGEEDVKPASPHPYSTGYINWRQFDCDEWEKRTPNLPKRSSDAVMPSEPPKYPDIWSYVPDLASGENIGQMVVLPDGDIGLEIYRKGHEYVRFQRLFFDKPLTLNDQCRIDLGMGKIPGGDIKLENGYILATRSVGHTKLCGDTLAGLGEYLVFMKNETDYNPSNRKYFISRIEKPRKWSMPDVCQDEARGRSFQYSLISVYPGTSLLLPDGTILVASNLGGVFGPTFVVRFTKDLVAKSNNIDNKIFILDEIPVCSEKVKGISTEECVHNKLNDLITGLEQGAK